MVRKFKKALVTGGAGFIGSHLSRLLISKGIKVTVIDNYTLGKNSNLKEIEKKIKIIEASILDNSIEKYFNDVDVVFHAAALVGVNMVSKEPVKVLDQNISGTKNILNICRKKNILHIFISSSEVYGNTVKMPVSENDTTSPVSPYGLSKIVGETYCHSFKKKYKTNSIIVRLFNVYGPRQDPTGYSWAVPSFIARTKRNKPCVVHGSGAQTRDFTFISDTIQGIYLAAIKGRYDEVYNIGTGIETSIKDVALIMLKKMNRSSKNIQYTRDRNFQITRRCANPSKAKKELGFKSKVKLSDGLDKTIQYFTWLK